MSFVTRVSTAVPRHAITQRDACAIVAKSLGLHGDRAQALERVFDHSGVERRYSVLPADALTETRSLAGRMELYRKNAAALAVQAAQRCMAEAGVEPRAIDFIATSSCTGVMLPSLAAVIGERLGLRDDARRVPLTEAGCAGGASVLARADDFLRAYPSSTALVVAVELPSLTLQHDDGSRDNFVASALFGDGAAAALVRGTAPSGLEILGTHAEVLPGSLGDLGFELRDGGFYVVLSKRIPGIIAEHARRVVQKLLCDHGLSERAVAFHVLHPGGPRILGALEDALCLQSGGAAISREVLRNYGNQSSASVLFVLKETMDRGPRDGIGLLAAFGPGITVELSLLRACA